MCSKYILNIIHIYIYIGTWEEEEGKEEGRGCFENFLMLLKWVRFFKINGVNLKSGYDIEGEVFCHQDSDVPRPCPPDLSPEGRLHLDETLSPPNS